MFTDLPWSFGNLTKLNSFLYNDNPWSATFQLEILILSTVDLLRILRAFAEGKSQGIVISVQKGLYHCLKRLLANADDTEGELMLSKMPALGNLTPLEYLVRFYPLVAEKLISEQTLNESDATMYMDTTLDIYGYPKSVPLEIPQNDQKYLFGGSKERVDKYYWRDRIIAQATNQRLTYHTVVNFFHNGLRYIRRRITSGRGKNETRRSVSITNAEFTVDSPLQPEGGADGATFAWPMEPEVAVQAMRDATFPVTSYTLPFPFMSGVVFLRVLLEVSVKTSSVAIFKNKNVEVAVVSAWISFGRKYHLFFCAYYSLYLALLTYTNVAYRSVASSNLPLMIVVVVLSFALLANEGAQIARERLGAYFSQQENWLELAAGLCVSVGGVLRIIADQETQTSCGFMAIGSLLSWFNAMGLLRPFDLTGPLVLMVYTVAVDIRPFFIILALILFAFSQFFFVVATFSMIIEDYFDTIQSAYYHTFAFMMGNALFDLDLGVNTKLYMAVLVLFIVFVVILLLNLLIAYLNNIYSGIQANAKAVGVRERCKIMVNQWWFRDRLGYKWVHFLKKNYEVDRDQQEQALADLTTVKLQQDMNVEFASVDTKIEELLKQLDTAASVNEVLNKKLDAAAAANVDTNKQLTEVLELLKAQTYKAPK